MNPAPSASFRRVIAAEVVSNFGSMMSRLAIPWLAVLALGATPWQMGLLAVADVLAGATAAIGIGVLVDRWPKRAAMVAADVARAALLVGLALAAARGGGGGGGVAGRGCRAPRPERPQCPACRRHSHQRGGRVRHHRGAVRVGGRRHGAAARRGELPGFGAAAAQWTGPAGPARGFGVCRRDAQLRAPVAAGGHCRHES
ncbi:MAG: MFS transporter [Rubrivivax sp.]|nr:MFS transporter [Rubrivivax sp.]